jgi:mono/diheme cytochrome c family protein
MMKINSAFPRPQRTVQALGAIALTLTLSTAIQAQDSAAGDLAPLQFTAAQAVGGGANFQRACASCHGAELEGMSAPALASETFSWLGLPVADFHGYIKELMPADAPGSLSDAQVSTIIAYIAQANGMAPGSVAMPTNPEDLGGIAFGQ